MEKKAAMVEKVTWDNHRTLSLQTSKGGVELYHNPIFPQQFSSNKLKI